MHLGVVVLTTTLLANALPASSWPFWWGGIMVLLSLTLAALCRHQSRRKVDDEHASLRAGWLHTALTTIVGLVWGGGTIGAGEADFQVLTLYSLALGGTALGAVSSQHAVPRSCFASIWTSTSLLALAHALHNPRLEGVLVALMMLLFAMILSILCVHMFRFLMTNQRLTQSLEEKVAELTVVAGKLDQARHAAEDANRAKSSFLAQASHDLRQPIHAIALLAASLEDTRLNKEQKQMLDGIEQSVDSVTSLFASLLDISRLDVGGVEPRPAPVNLGLFLERMCAQNRDLAARNGCSVSYVSTSLWVHTDANLLFTMVQNVLGNAFKYASGSRVLIGPRRINGKLALQICDTGPGIDAEHLDAVFNEFYRLERARAERHIEGMGLGLAIVRGLGDLMGLQVTLSSTPGRGTSVRISGFERADPLVEPTPRRSHAHPLFGKRICLIDDDETVRLATTRLLERWGCTVSAFSGVEAISGPFDAILADLELGDEKSGLDVVAALNANAKHPVPAVILTGHDDDATQERIAESRLPVLSKPVRPTELRAMLTRLCIGL